MLVESAALSECKYRVSPALDMGRPAAFSIEHYFHPGEVKSSNGAEWAGG